MYCSNEYCDNEAEGAVSVSYEAYGDETRLLCTTCRESYVIGVQHGTFRAIHLAFGSSTDTPSRLFLETDEVRDRAIRRWEDELTALEEEKE